MPGDTGATLARYPGSMEAQIKILFALTLAAGIGLSIPAAHAASSFGGPAHVDGSITLVEGGCGPGGHRDRFGYCRPNGPPPPIRRFYGCPPYTHPTPYGCRRNF